MTRDKLGHDAENLAGSATSMSSAMTSSGSRENQSASRCAFAGQAAPDRVACCWRGTTAIARVLPWRMRPGVAADPYRVWLSEIMLQQTTVRAVGPYFAKFTARWPDIVSLAAASQDDVLREWAGLGYYSRARNLYACAARCARTWRTLSR